MSGVTKCSNAECPIRLKCYRFTAKSSYYQGWDKFTYDSGCIRFIENKNKSIK